MLRELENQREEKHGLQITILIACLPNANRHFYRAQVYFTWSFVKQLN